MRKPFCPAYIKALLHCHCSPEPLRDAPVNEQALALFLREGLVKPTSDKEKEAVYQTTPRGAALIAAWCYTPIPEGRFVDHMGNIYSAHDTSGTPLTLP